MNLLSFLHVSFLIKIKYISFLRNNEISRKLTVEHRESLSAIVVVAHPLGLSNFVKQFQQNPSVSHAKRNPFVKTLL